METLLTKKCSRCGKVKPLSEFGKTYKVGGCAYRAGCKTCKTLGLSDEVKARRRDYSRKKRKTPEQIADYVARFPKKIKAHKAVTKAILNGILLRGCCEVCGKARTYAHHVDYDKPLEVMWLCGIHHSAWHQLNGEGLNGI